MKHLKSYKLFESISNRDLELDVRDMFLELEEDYGYGVELNLSKINSVDMLSIELFKDQSFSWIDIKDYIERVKEYVEGNSLFILDNIVLYYCIKEESQDPSKDQDFESFTTPKGSYLDWDRFTQFAISKGDKINELSLIFNPKK